MNEKIKILITSKLHELFLAKGKNPASDEIVILWIKYLESYPPEKLIEAFETEIRSNNDFPTLGRILNYIDPLPNPENESNEAWNKLLSDISSGRETYSKEQMDICRQIAGSITAIRQANEFGLSTMKKNFIRVYSKKVKKQIEEKIKISVNKNNLIGTK